MDIGPTDDAASGWQRAAAIPPLGPDEVHLWRIPVSQPESVLTQWRASLSPDELTALARYRFPADAARFLASRGTRRHLLAHHLGLAPAALTFTAGPHGKPQLTAAPTSDFNSGAHHQDVASPASLEFNASHSGDWVLLALARGHPIGVDIERWRELPDRALLMRYFAPAEVAEWTALAEAARQEGFFNGWTRKEAYLKALGAGLAKPLDSFQVRLAPSQPAALLGDSESPARVSRWQLLALPMPPGYTAALALPRAATRVSLLDWA